MAGSFQPKFVDLVRNYTTTVGTGLVPTVPAPAGDVGGDGPGGPTASPPA